MDHDCKGRARPAQHPVGGVRHDVLVIVVALDRGSTAEDHPQVPVHVGLQRSQVGLRQRASNSGVGFESAEACAHNAGLIHDRLKLERRRRAPKAE